MTANGTSPCCARRSAAGDWNTTTSRMPAATKLLVPVGKRPQVQVAERTAGVPAELEVEETGWIRKPDLLGRVVISYRLVMTAPIRSLRMFPVPRSQLRSSGLGGHGAPGEPADELGGALRLITHDPRAAAVDQLEAGVGEDARKTPGV